jgi:hypothetical protein
MSQYRLLKHVFELFLSRSVIYVFVLHRPHAAGLFLSVGYGNDWNASRTVRRTF